MTQQVEPDPSEEDRRIAEYLLHESTDREGEMCDSVRRFVELRDRIARLTKQTPKETIIDSAADAETPATRSTVPNTGTESLPRYLGKYRIDALIDDGGMSNVYRGHDIMLERDVAIKIPKPELRDRPEFRERFLREGRLSILEMADHPHLCKIFDLDEKSDELYIVMELLDGEPFSRWISQRETQRDAPAHECDVVRILSQVCQGMASAHEQGVVHRDLKPSNIMILPSGEAVVLDFGLAAHRGEVQGANSEVLTQTGALIGTPPYMSPEQTLGKRGDERSDIFSLGVVLYQAMTGRLPFEGVNNLSTMKLIREAEPTPISEICPTADPKLIEICRKLMSKDPIHRYGSMREVSAEFDHWMQLGTSRHASRPAFAYVGACAIGFILFSILVFNTRSGTVRFEIPDQLEGVSIHFNDDTFTIASNGKSKSLRAGTYPFQVRIAGREVPIGEEFKLTTDHDRTGSIIRLSLDGVTLTSNQFTVQRGEQHVFTVSIVPSKSDATGSSSASLDPTPNDPTPNDPGTNEVSGPNSNSVAPAVISVLNLESLATAIKHAGEHPITLEAIVVIPEVYPSRYEILLSNVDRGGLRLAFNEEGWKRLRSRLPERKKSSIRTR